MNIYQKFGVILLSYIFLGWFVCQPLTDVGRYKPYFQMSENGHEITHDELNDFLYVWANMMQSSFGKSFSSKSLKSGDKYPEGLQKWLALQYWNIDRFFYDEQRIRDLLEYVEIKRQLDDNKKIAKASRINLNDMNKDLQKRLEANSYNDYELELIEANLYQIGEVLSGRAVLKK